MFYKIDVLILALCLLMGYQRIEDTSPREIAEFGLSFGPVALQNPTSETKRKILATCIKFVAEAIVNHEIQWENK